MNPGHCDVLAAHRQGESQAVRVTKQTSSARFIPQVNLLKGQQVCVIAAFTSDELAVFVVGPTVVGTE